METKRFTFEDLPSILGNIISKLETIDNKVDQFVFPKENEDKWMNIKELCNYLPNHPAEQTIYGWTSNRLIPYYKKGKTISFLRSEIDLWLKKGYKKNKEDIEKEAKEFIVNKKRRKW